VDSAAQIIRNLMKTLCDRSSAGTVRPGFENWLSLGGFGTVGGNACMKQLCCNGLSGDCDKLYNLDISVYPCLTLGIVALYNSENIIDAYDPIVGDNYGDARIHAENAQNIYGQSGFVGSVR
jgi:hypothetical protein